MRVLIVEYDLTSARGVALMLRSGGAVVDHAGTGEEGLAMVRRYDYDIVVVDLMLPDMEGFDVVRRMRAVCVEVPVLFLSGLCRPQAKVKGLALGADDILTPPFDQSELIARLQAAVSRGKGFSQRSLRVGNLQLSFDSSKVAVDQRPVQLTRQEHAILELLVVRRGMVLTTEDLLNHLYGGTEKPEMRIIDVFVCTLRKKLTQAGAEGLICTVWGRGYMIREALPNTGDCLMFGGAQYRR